MPLVSVIIPVYNRAHCVMDAINSALEQTHHDVECIVVDDGSSDGSAEVVSRACAHDARVRVFAAEHGGVSAARNRGLRELRGEYVTFLDSDDLMPPTRIRRQLDLLVELECDAVLGCAESFVMPGVAPPPWLEARPEWGRGYDWNTFLVATEHLRTVGDFDEALEMGEDIDLLVRLRIAGFRVSAVDELFNVRRFFGDNLTYAMDESDSSLRDAIRRQVRHRRNDSG